jgi:hypothetical protein
VGQLWEHGHFTDTLHQNGATALPVISVSSLLTMRKVVGAVGIEPTNHMETKEFCGAPRPSKVFKGTEGNP